MPSKRSCFNKALFKKHLSRFWPLWGGVSLVGALFPLYLLLALMQRMPGVIDRSSEFREGLYQIATFFVPAFTFFYAILCVMAVWGYLYNARSVGMMHTLPVDRTCLFITNTLSALAMVLTPYAVTGGLVCLIALGWGFFDLVAVVNTVLAVLFLTLLFTGMATLCAMLTGHAFVLPVFYLLTNFLAFLMEILTTSLAHEFLIGIPMAEDMRRTMMFSPLVQIYSSFSTYREQLSDETVISHLRGFWVVALYALAGLGMLALAWFLYKRRHSESAGDVVAFRWLRPIFRYGVALLSGLTIGRLLYELMWATLFQRGDYAQVLPMAVCIFLGALTGYYAASMLLAKSLRVFGRKSLPGVGIVAAGAVALCLLVSVDVFGLEKKVPEMAEIACVSITDQGLSSTWFADETPEQAEALREFHQAIVSDLDYIRSYVPNWELDEGKVFSHYINLEYHLKDGSILWRQYDLWLTEDRAGTTGTFDNLLSEFYKDPEVRAYDVRIPDDAELDSIDIYCNYMDGWHLNTSDHADGDNRETRLVYEALQKDAQEGHFPPQTVLQYYGTRYPENFYLQINYHGFYDGGYYGRSKTLYLSPSMTNTLDTLIELGYITRENVEQWKKDLAAWEQDKAYGDTVYAEAYTVPAG